MEEKQQISEEQYLELEKHFTQMKHYDRKQFNRVRKPLSTRFAKTIMNRLK